MINAELEQIINEQINKELYSEYLYLAMKLYFEDLNLQGFVNWFDIQVQEEHAHAMGFVNYLIERGGQVKLMAIDAPEIKGSTPLEVFKQVLEHEEYVTSLINGVADVAEKVKDRAAMSFVDWYIKEQVEEEASVGGVLKTLELIGDDKNALLLFDKDLGARVFNPPVIG